MCSSDLMNSISEFGFLPLKFNKFCSNIDDILKSYRDILNMRNDYSMLLDGVVIRVDDMGIQKELGYTIKAPRFACAYKFPAIEKSSKILSVTFQVGRSGAITPVADLEPTEIDGATISRATLHNFSEIEKKNIMINDKVIVIRSGDVIPKIIKPIEAFRDGSQIAIQKPTNCPVCKSELLIEDILIKCQNLSCEARVKESIIHFASKKAMNIDGMGDRIVEQLFNEGIIKNIEDIYMIKYENLVGLDGWKDRKIKNLLDSIETTKGIELWRFINSLGISHIGEGASKKLAENFGIDAFNVSFEKIESIDGFGSEIAESIVEFSCVNREQIERLLEIVKPKVAVSKIRTDSIFTNKNIVLTGSMSESRDAISAILESFGAKIVSSVSKNTDFVIHGESAGSKLEKAISLGIAIMSEKEMREKILEE